VNCLLFGHRPPRAPSPKKTIHAVATKSPAHHAHTVLAVATNFPAHRAPAAVQPTLAKAASQLSSESSHRLYSVTIESCPYCKISNTHDSADALDGRGNAVIIDSCPHCIVMPMNARHSTKRTKVDAVAASSAATASSHHNLLSSAAAVQNRVATSKSSTEADKAAKVAAAAKHLMAKYGLTFAEAMREVKAEARRKSRVTLMDLTAASTTPGAAAAAPPVAANAIAADFTNARMQAKADAASRLQAVSLKKYSGNVDLNKALATAVAESNSAQPDAGIAKNSIKRTSSAATASSHHNLLSSAAAVQNRVATSKSSTEADKAAKVAAAAKHLMAKYGLTFAEAMRQAASNSKSILEADATKFSLPSPADFASKVNSVASDSKQFQQAAAAAKLKSTNLFKANSATNTDSLNSSLQDSASALASLPHMNVDAPMLSPRDSEGGVVPANFFVF
jgi:hypothetical protein